MPSGDATVTVLRVGDVLHGTLDAGPDLHAAYQDLARAHDVDAAYVLSGIGMLADPEVGYFVGEGRYERAVLEGNYELVSTMGNLALHDGEPFTHLHVSLAGPDHRVVGGHLFAGAIAVTHECALQVLPPGSLERRTSEATGLLTLCAQEPQD